MPVLDTIHKIYRNTASQPTQNMRVTVTEGTLHTALLVSQENTPPAIQD